jgi:hypothetical protein
MTVSFPDHWKTALSHQPVADVAASMREEAINEFLRVHHKVDAGRYTVQFERTFVANGVARTFQAVMKAETPIQTDVAPFTLSWIKQAVWNNLDTPPGLASFRKSADEDPDANVRLFCEKVTLTLKWPKLDGSGTWSFSPNPLRIVAEAYVGLEETKPEDTATYQFKLRLQPKKITIDPASMIDLHKLVQKQLPALVGDEQQAFTDLLVIVMNIVAGEYAPKLVRDIEIPTPIVAKQKIIPCLLAVRDKIVTVGGAIDLHAVTQNNSNYTSRVFAQLEAAIERDIAQYGGLANLAMRPGQERIAIEDAEFYSPEEILRDRMPGTRALLDGLQEKTNQLSYVKLEAEGGDPLSSFGTTTQGIAIAVDEYLLDKVVRSAVPAPTQSCSEWATLLDFVRGRTCHWARISNAEVTISGTTVAGAASVDVGGALEACIRKFWDCSWRWECGSLAIGVAGRPQVVFFVQPSASGIAFKARVNGNLQLVTNLPFPFNKVIEAFGGIIIALAEALINIFLTFVVFQIAVPEVSVPNQKTKIKFENFVPFSFTRTSPSTIFTEQQRLLAFTADVNPH